MRMTSLKINGRTVSKLYINGREVALGQTLTELCFTAEEANSSVTLKRESNPPSIFTFNGLEYKLNDGDWTSYNIGSTISLANVGDKVYMRAVAAGNQQMGAFSNNYHYFVMTGKIAASGNINTLLNPDPTADVSLEGKGFCYYGLFSGCTSLTRAPELPSTTLGDNCYLEMFKNCTSLTSAPKILPATNLTIGCYGNMFDGCSSLTKAPVFSATTLADHCYHQTFYNCQSLNYVKVAFTNWTSGAIYSWLYGVSATGTFECPQTLIYNTTTRGDNTVPESWNMVAV